nr:Rpn family recombination-promoting nuclease/putative transposase [Paenibacillus kribbensis]
MIKLILNGGLINWLLFLKGADPSKWEVLKMNEPGLEKAMDTLQFLSQDSEARRLYEARQKYLHDEASMIDRAESIGMAKGLEKGLTKGKEDEKKNIAKNMLSMGLDIATIAKATGLTEKEIKSIQI